MLRELPLLAGFRVVPYYALARFGKWDELLREPAPPADSAFLTAAWHYTQGLAFVARGRLDEAEQRARLAEGRAAGQVPGCAAVLAELGKGRAVGRAGSAGGRDRGDAEGLRRGHRASRTGRASRGRPGLHRAGRVALPAAAGARRGAARGGSSRRGRDRLLGGPPAQPGERLVAPRVARRAAGPRQDRGGGSDRGAASKVPGHAPTCSSRRRGSHAERVRALPGTSRAGRRARLRPRRFASGCAVPL